MQGLDDPETDAGVVPDRQDPRLEQILRARLELDQATTGLRRAVAEARSAGRSWAKIGATLGVSKQAAQRRFGR